MVHRAGTRGRSRTYIIQDVTYDIGLQLLYSPKVVTEIRDRLNTDILVHLLHMLRTHLHQTDPARMLFAFRKDSNSFSLGYLLFCWGKVAAFRGQARAHHVCAGEQEADGAAVDTDAREDEGIWIRVSQTSSSYLI